MNSSRQPHLILLALVLGALLAGCSTTRTTDDNTIPWSRPADWEGGIPGMSSMPGGGGAGYGGH